MYDIYDFTDQIPKDLLREADKLLLSSNTKSISEDEPLIYFAERK